MYDEPWESTNDDPRIGTTGMDNTCLIPLTKNMYAIVDAEDYEMLSKYKWSYHRSGYASRNVYSHMLGGKEKTKTIFMHRVINKTPKDLVTDHINGDKLDNRKSNLRSVTRSQNAANLMRMPRSNSGYYGVSYHRMTSKWQAYGVYENGKTYYIGIYDTAYEAAQARDNYVKRVFGECAKLNFEEELDANF